LRNLLQLCSLIYSTKIQNIWRWVWMIASMVAAAAVICWHWLSSTEIYCSEESQVNLSWWGWRGCGDSRSWPLIPHHVVLMSREMLTQPDSLVVFVACIYTHIDTKNKSWIFLYKIKFLNVFRKFWQKKYYFIIFLDKKNNYYHYNKYYENI
jgi:hypothetical protein